MTDDHYEGFGFYFLAVDYWKSAVYIQEGRDNGKLELRFKYTVPYYLYVHSIELALKAFLRAKGVEKRNCRREGTATTLKVYSANAFSRECAWTNTNGSSLNG